MPWANNQHTHRQAQAVIMASKHTLTRLIEFKRARVSTVSYHLYCCYPHNQQRMILLVFVFKCQAPSALFTAQSC